MARRGGSAGPGVPPTSGAVLSRVGKLSGAAAAVFGRGAAFGGIGETDIDRDPLGEPLGPGAGSSVFGGPPPPPAPPTFLDPQRGATPAYLTPQPQRMGTLALRLTDVTVRASVWTQIQIDRPMILWPRSSLVGSFLRYSPDTPDPALVRSQTSVRSGIGYLPTPGLWWLFCNSGSDQNYILIDASDPAVAVRYLAEPGNQILSDIVVSAASIGTSAAGNSAQLVAFNRERTGIIVANNDPAVPLLVAFDTTAGGAYVAASTAVVRVAINETLELFGDQCHRGNLVAWWQGGAVGTVGPSVFQYF